MGPNSCYFSGENIIPAGFFERDKRDGIFKSPKDLKKLGELIDRTAPPQIRNSKFVNTWRQANFGYMLCYRIRAVDYTPDPRTGRIPAITCDWEWAPCPEQSVSGWRDDKHPAAPGRDTHPALVMGGIPVPGGIVPAGAPFGWAAKPAAAPAWPAAPVVAAHMKAVAAAPPAGFAAPPPAGFAAPPPAGFGAAAPDAAKLDAIFGPPGQHPPAFGPGAAAAHAFGPGAGAAGALFQPDGSTNSNSVMVGVTVLVAIEVRAVMVVVRAAEIAAAMAVTVMLLLLGNPERLTHSRCLTASG